MRKIFYFPLIVFILSVVVFFKAFLVNGKLPIPADTIIGLYHPFRDLYAKDYPNGIPYKNFLITDPVRQQYPWRFLGIEVEKKGEFPLWNPYSLGGTPLLGSLQGAVFYPLNLLLFILPFSLGWSILILLQPLLAGIFLYLYLKNLRLSAIASLFGSITFSFCGFFIAWLEWGTLVHIVLWLPLILLSVDKLLINKQNKKLIIWSLIFVLALSSSLLAGHFQLFAYILLTSILYYFIRWWQYGRSKKSLLIFLLFFGSFLIITFIQWFPTIQFILQSARGVDQAEWQKEGWFIPWQHLAQFIAPDFFGNPTTLNYWGVWNYGELVGYVGIVPLMMSFYAMFYRRDKKTLFFSSLLFLSLLFSLPTILAQFPYIFNIPFLSSSQPTRLLVIIDFSLSVLAALGIDWFMTHKNKKQILLPLLLVALTLGALWVIVIKNPGGNMLVAKRNLYLPTILIIISSIILICNIFIKNKKIIFVLMSLLILITVFDLNRFGQKFIPFTNKDYLFPNTKVLTFLQKDQDQFRIMTTDSRIMPPNFSIMYHLQNVGGYDPLYLMRYGELIAASERNTPNIQPPFGFNRIITPSNTTSRIMDLMGVKYVLSFSELPSPKFLKVFEEGQTKIYKNNEAYPRVFMIANLKNVKDKQETINALFDKNIDLHKTAIVDQVGYSSFAQGTAKISYYSENKIIIDVENSSIGFLVLTDTYYPTWHAKICSDNNEGCLKTKIHLTDYNFRGVVVPAGKHSIEFYNTLL